MREIKFRAYYKNKNKLVYGLEGDDDFDKGFWEGNYTSYLGMLNNCLNVKDIEYSQYTGLKDKNGKEVYEGDIIDWGFNGIEVVSYGIEHVDAFEGVGFNLWGFYDDLEDNATRLQREIEIIGNIYENPELIPSKEND